MATCCRCGTEHAVGYVKTTSPTGSLSFDFRLCMREILILEHWLKDVKVELPKEQTTLG
jgi:hypothetical protein